MVNFYYSTIIIGLFIAAIFIIFWDVLSKKPQTKNICICPKCKSKNVSPDLSAHSFAQGSVFNKYKCNKCGYEGMFFPEVNKKWSKRTE